MTVTVVGSDREDVARKLGIARLGDIEITMTYAHVGGEDYGCGAKKTPLFVVSIKGRQDVSRHTTADGVLSHITPYLMEHKAKFA